jgi:hypothetical protein
LGDRAARACVLNILQKMASRACAARLGSCQQSVQAGLSIRLERIEEHGLAGSTEFHFAAKSATTVDVTRFGNVRHDLVTISNGGLAIEV